MSNEIIDLIANIQQKFDDEFNEHINEQTFNENYADKNQLEYSYNPESDRKDFQENQLNKQVLYKKEQIIIEQYQQNYDSSQIVHDYNNVKNKKQMYENKSLKSHDENDEQQQDDNKYKQLSHKLQTALKKISSSKKQFATFNSTSTTSDYLNRFQEYQRKKQKDLQAKRKAQQQKKVYGLKSKPDINEKSRQMATQTSYKPIHERYDEVIQAKKKKIEAGQQTKKIKQEQQYEQIIEQFKKYNKIQPQQCRDTQTYFKDMMVWKQKLEKQRSQKAKQKLQKQKQGYTFKPELNKKSVRMVKNQKRIPIQERQIERHKTQVNQYTFKPKINKKRTQ